MPEGDSAESKEKITTTIEVDKDLFLKFKALCVLNETTISGEIENLLKKRVDQLTKKDENSIVKME
jgi:hypothetical protein